MSDAHDRIIEAVEAAEHGKTAIPLPETRLSRVLDAVVNFFGQAVSWLWVVLIGIIITNVVLRYVFNEGLILFEELQWHVYAIGFMIGLSFAVVADRHVRIDVAAEHLSTRGRAWIELFGLFLFLLPFSILVAIEAVPFVQRAWDMGEVSIAPGGLGHRWALKAVIVVAFVLIALAALARLSRVTSLLFRFPRPLPPREG
ncbi:TRAP transporter small permease subunit [Amorphus orientalis]|uniref:TRAP transporter small permease protein n=1 Tax=Amorphus orientalis TaxID=649198 RepID=A0AAE3VRV5_9HYPH|nr:TRAP transporter small permease subunit [Amorphus orientalis]MDQ0316521.1 TRAP-type mannitol/chloroaromatic compound transport system permease small subunit [Amorphus orientalis]